MNRPRIVQVLPGSHDFTLYVTWQDGSSSSVDLSEPVHRLKYFAPLRDAARFRKVRVADWGWAIEWGDDLDYSADALWRRSQEQSGRAMSAGAFRDWRTSLGYTLDSAAQALGISRRTVIYYESGEQQIPKHVWLACERLTSASPAERERILHLPA